MGQVAHCGDDERLSIWYARPAPHLARYITAYDAYHSRLDSGEEAGDVIPPAWGAIRLTLTPEPWAARIGRRCLDPVPRDALFGPSSHAAFTRFGRGQVVCAGLTPLGWARFVTRDASRFADRITPLAAVWPERAAALRAAVEGTSDHKGAFDAFFSDLVDRTEPEDEVIGRLASLLLEPGVSTITELAERLGIEPRHLGRVSTRHFGFTPKLLLRRARFLRVMVRMLQTERGKWKTLVGEAGYHDQSHFVRDCQLFLDMPMTDFARLPKPLFEGSLRLRAAVLGSPAQAMHRIDELP